MSRLGLLVLAALLGIGSSAGCGKKGPPLPPLPRGPLPPRGVAARQLGNAALVGFELPSLRGARPSQEPASAELLRVEFAAGLRPPVDPQSFRRRGSIVGRATLEAASPGARLTLVDEQLSELPEHGLGFTLRYAVRLLDRKGRPSPLVVAHDLVPLPSLGAPQGLTAEPTAAGIRLSWQSTSAEPETEPVYNIYRRRPAETPAERPLNPEPIAATEYLDSEVETGQTYVYTVRTALAAEPPYREGESSAGIEIVAEDRFAPEPPRGLVAVQEGMAVRLFWDPSRERDLAGYRVFRSVDGGPWGVLAESAIEQAQYLDEAVELGQRLAYRVTAIDRASRANESEPSAAVEVDPIEVPR